MIEQYSKHDALTAHRNLTQPIDYLAELDTVQVLPTSKTDKDQQVEENHQFFFTLPADPLAIGYYFIAKYKKLVAKNGARRVANQLNKQGIEFDVAHQLIFGCSPRY